MKFKKWLSCNIRCTLYLGQADVYYCNEMKTNYRTLIFRSFCMQVGGVVLNVRRELLEISYITDVGDGTKKSISPQIRHFTQQVVKSIKSYSKHYKIPIHILRANEDNNLAEKNVPHAGLEPTTCLQVGCSTNWANQAYNPTHHHTSPSFLPVRDGHQLVRHPQIIACSCSLCFSINWTYYQFLAFPRTFHS